MKKKILIVDDDDALRKSLTAALSARGFEVLQADNGLDGAELAAAQKPDVIVADVYMPNMNGFMMADMLQDDPMTASIPIIMMTSAAQAAGAWQSKTDVEYLDKPFEHATLIDIINRLLSRSK